MENGWFFESLFPDAKFGLKIKKNLYSARSKFQKIKFLESRRLGKFLILDDVIQTSTWDEFVYHEMMAHIPLFSHPQPQDIIIIGGGDGGVLREVLKHRTVRKVTLVEIDKQVISNSKRYLPEICQDSFQSKKLELIIADAADFVKTRNNAYNVAIIDSPDPIGPGKVLFQNKFYQNLSTSLKKDGVMVRQSGSSFFQQEELKDNYKRLSRFFRYHAVYTAAIPTYVGGLFNFIFCSFKINPKNLSLETLRRRFAQLKSKTRYYNSEIHIACFKLPNYIKEIIGGEK